MGLRNVSGLFCRSHTNGETLLERAYGMADLEWGIPNTPETIFEGGSVSKQFAAAAVVLLVLDGVLSLEDDIRQWVPEIQTTETQLRCTIS